jgi:hypothetical protein
LKPMAMNANQIAIGHSLYATFISQQSALADCIINIILTKIPLVETNGNEC